MLRENVFASLPRENASASNSIDQRGQRPISTTLRGISGKAAWCWTWQPRKHHPLLPG